MATVHHHDAAGTIAALGRVLRVAPRAPGGAPAAARDARAIRPPSVVATRPPRRGLAPAGRPPGRELVALAAPVEEFEEARQQPRGAALVRIHVRFALEREARRDDDRLLGAVLADPACP